MCTMRKLITLLFFLLVFSFPGFSSDLKFVVISDTNPDFWSQKDFSVFEREIQQIDALKPDLVVNLGDLIYGYGLRSTRSQWERYLEIIKKVDAPYYQIPGNHDVFNSRSRQIYLEIFGRTYRSFDSKNYHFILIDNLEDNTWGKIDEEQLAWLKKDLVRPEWQGAFVFVHVPVWDLKARNVKGEWREFWFRKIHPLLEEAKVKAVFAGHTHRFGPTRIYDGIHYYIAGGGGPRVNPVYIRNGGTNFFLLVEVSDNGFQVKVVTENRIMSEQEADILKELFGPYYYQPDSNNIKK